MDRFCGRYFFVFCLFTFLFLGGCTAVVLETGEQAYNHVRGDLLGIVPEPLETVYGSSVKALENMKGYDISECSLNSLEGCIIAYGKRARKVQIKLSRTEHDQTRVSIRIGILGDKIESVHIYDRIQRYLHLEGGSPVDQ